jgi:hypothetical protein
MKILEAIHFSQTNDSFVIIAKEEGNDFENHYLIFDGRSGPEGVCMLVEGKEVDRYELLKWFNSVGYKDDVVVEVVENSERYNHVDKLSLSIKKK